MHHDVSSYCIYPYPDMDNVMSVSIAACVNFEGLGKVLPPKIHFFDIYVLPVAFLCRYSETLLVKSELFSEIGKS